MKKFALAGNPNCGKTTLFNSLTGSTAHVGNWPGVTVDKREGTYKKCAEPVSIVDLPGIYSLSPYTPEEVISRNFILDEKPDCVINIVDATNLERNLYLTTQIMEIDVPMVIALNMMDEVEKQGDKIDATNLEKKIGIPVVPISALKEKGLEELMKRAYDASNEKRQGKTVLEGSALMHLIGDCKIALEGQGVDNALFHAIKLVELDELEVKAHPQSTAMVEEFKKTFSDDTFGNDFEALVADSRYKYISKHYSSVLTKSEQRQKEKLSRSDKADKILTHKVWGIPIFLVILFLVFHLTFAEDFLFLGAGGVFDKEAVAYDVNKNVIEVTEDTYDPDNVKYYDADGNEAELTFENGKLASVEAKPFVFTGDGKKVLVENAAELPEGTKFYANEKGKWEVTIEATQFVYWKNSLGEVTRISAGDAKNLAEGTKIYADEELTHEVTLNADGEVEGYADIETEYESAFVSGIDEFCAGISAATFFGYEESVYGPGVILANLLNTFTDFLSTCINEGLVKSGAPDWLTGLIVDGIFGGLFAVLGFLPQILLLFLFFSILEDSGYMARVAFILDRIFRRFGLSGRAFMPMIMGFGCSVPAFINTRTLADEKERVATIRVIPFFSCGAKLPILTAIAGGIATMTGLKNPDVITYCMYILGVVVAIACVLLMRATTMKGDVPPFIMELPAYHVPQPKNLMLHLWDKTKHFVKKAFTIILASTIVIWFMSHFSWNWNYLEDTQMNQSILAGIGGIIRPLFTPLGLGSQIANSFGWVFAVAAITGLIAKENVIATFGTLAACIVGGMIDVEADGGLMAVAEMIKATGIGVPGLIAFIAFNMLTIPCFAAVATAKAELPSKKSFRNTLLFWIGTSYIVAMMIYLIGSWWWTVFIFAAIWAAIITLIVLDNKCKIDVNGFFKNLKGKMRKAKE